MNKPDMLLWLDDHRGQYIPRDFANSFINRDRHVSGVSPDGWYVLEQGPDHENYWDYWNDVLNDATVTMDDVRYRLHQDGALWLVPEGMEWCEDSESFEWPEGHFEQRDGKFVCHRCGYELSAMMADNEVPDVCPACNKAA